MSTNGEEEIEGYDDQLQICHTCMEPFDSAIGTCSACWKKYNFALDHNTQSLKGGKWSGPLTLATVADDVYPIDCFDSRNVFRGVVWTSSRFTRILWNSDENVHQHDIPLLWCTDYCRCQSCHTKDHNKAHLMSFVTVAEQNQMEKNLNDPTKKWYQDEINTNVKFIRGIAKMWRTERIDLYCSIYECSMELYEIEGKARAIIYLTDFEILTTWFLDGLCCDVEDHVEESMDLKRRLDLLNKNRLDAIKISIVGMNKVVRSHCYHCEVKMTKKKRKGKCKCKGCKIAVYCSRWCQKKDWCVHRRYCKNGRLVLDQKDDERYLHNWR